MPAVFKQSIDASLSTEVWKITESEAFFLSQLTLGEDDKKTIPALSLLSRRLEKLACRAALKDLLQEHSLPVSLENLHYSAQGAPFLEPYRLSFSHNRQYTAVALSTTRPVGIDIERIGIRLEKLYPRFLNEKEIANCNPHNPCELHYYWGAKEAIYKVYALTGINFSRDILILPRERKGCLRKNGTTHTFQLWHKQIDDNCLVIARPESSSFI